VVRDANINRKNQETIKAALSASNISFTCNTFKTAVDELQMHKKAMERLRPLEKEKGVDTIFVNPAADLGELSPAGALHSCSIDWHACAQERMVQHKP